MSFSLSDINSITVRRADTKDRELLAYMNRWVEDRSIWDVYAVGGVTDELQMFDKASGTVFTPAFERMLSLVGLLLPEQISVDMSYDRT